MSAFFEACALIGYGMAMAALLAAPFVALWALAEWYSARRYRQHRERAAALLREQERARARHAQARSDAGQPIEWHA